MLEVKIPSEIRSYKSKVFLGLTVRQIISIGGSLAVGISLGLFGGKIIPADILMWAIILCVAPIVAWGFAKFKGMRFEEFIVVLFKYNFLPQKRVYEDSDVNYFSEIKNKLCECEIIRQRIHNGELDESDIKSETGEDYVF